MSLLSYPQFFLHTGKSAILLILIRDKLGKGMLSSQTDESDSLDIIIFLFLQCKLLLIDQAHVCTDSGTKGSGIVLFVYSAAATVTGTGRLLCRENLA